MRKQRKRKIYKLMNPISLATENAAITQAADLDKLRMRELAAIDLLARGAGTLEDFHEIIAMVNLCEQMAISGIGPEALEACSRAEAAIISLCGRMEATGHMQQPSADELQAVRDVFGYLDLQRQSVSRGEFERVIKKTVARVRNCAPGVIEL